MDLHGRRLRTVMTDALGYDPQCACCSGSGFRVGCGETSGLDLHGRRLRTVITDALGYDPQCACRLGFLVRISWNFFVRQAGWTCTAGACAPS